MVTRSDSTTAAPRLAIIGPIKAWGGIEGKIVTLCREFADHGVRPEIVLLRGGEVPYPERLDTRVAVHHLRTHSKRDGVPAVRDWLRHHRPDAVLTLKDHGAQVVLLARMLGRLDVPVYVKVTNTLSLVARRAVQRWMIRRLYPRADGVIGNSAGVVEDLARSFAIPRQRLHTIHNPTVTEDFPVRAEADVGHPWLGADAAVPVVIGVGRFTAQKDFSLLLRAFARVRREFPCRLILLGDGPDRAALEAEVERLGMGGDVDMPGFVADTLPYVARAALFVLSSRYEGLSNVLIEALAVGTPAVATDCPSGSAEILEQGRWGRLVPVGDEEALAAAMQAALEDPGSHPVPVTAVDRFRAGPVARRYLEVMRIASGREAA